MKLLLVAPVLLLAACASSSDPDIRLAPPDGVLLKSAGLVGNSYQVRAHGTNVDLATVPLAPFLGALPMTGTADVDVSVDVDTRGVDLASGHVNVTCTDCRIGDDHAKLKPTMDPTAAAVFGDGLDFGHLAIDRFVMRASVDRGIAKISTWEWASPDLDLEVSGSITISKDPGKSALHGCIRFKPTDKLRDEQPKTFAVLATTGAPLAADGYYTIAVEGPLDHPKRLGRICP